MLMIFFDKCFVARIMLLNLILLLLLSFSDLSCPSKKGNKHKVVKRPESLRHNEIPTCVEHFFDEEEFLRQDILNLEAQERLRILDQILESQRSMVASLEAWQEGALFDLDEIFSSVKRGKTENGILSKKIFWVDQRLENQKYFCLNPEFLNTEKDILQKVRALHQQLLLIIKDSTNQNKGRRFYQAMDLFLQNFSLEEKLFLEWNNDIFYSSEMFKFFVQNPLKESFELFKALKSISTLMTGDLQYAFFDKIFNCLFSLIVCQQAYFCNIYETLLTKGCSCSKQETFPQDNLDNKYWASCGHWFHNDCFEEGCSACLYSPTLDMNNHDDLSESDSPLRQEPPLDNDSLPF